MTRTRRIEPRTLKGFRDMTPDLMIRKEAMLEHIRAVLRQYGFVPIDTPVLEYAEVLLAKVGGETEKQVYRFEDQGGRDVAMRFDLTVPLARFAAMHGRGLGTPFKRYHMGPVWRGENTARGRFREFWQCDFDTVGTRSPLADLETAVVICRLMEALDVGSFTLHISDRGLLAGLVHELGIDDRFLAVLRAIDKLGKAGRQKVVRELEVDASLGASQVDAIFDLIELGGAADDVLDAVEERLGRQAAARAGLDRLRVVIDGLRAVGIAEDTYRLDLSIARGLDYYTGTIYETYLRDTPEHGSVCSGGRYDDLASLYTSDVLPGVGASLGLDRLMDALESRADRRASTARVLVLLLDPANQMEALRMAEELRAASIPTELYLEPKRIQKQLQYAARRGIEVAVIAGEEEFERGWVNIKELRRGVQEAVERSKLVGAVRAALDEGS